MGLPGKYSSRFRDLFRGELITGRAGKYPAEELWVLNKVEWKLKSMVVLVGVGIRPLRRMAGSGEKDGREKKMPNI